MTPDIRAPMNDERELKKKLDALGWGLFLIWMGIAFLGSVGWGAALLGVGIITLGGQVARRYFGLPVETFSLIVGAAICAGGLWYLLDLRLSQPFSGALLPIVCIVAGALVLLSALRSRPAHRGGR